MRRNGVVTILLFMMIATSSVRLWAQTDDANRLTTLSDYLSYAALNNAQLKADFESWKMALEQIPQAGALDDPRFTYTYFIQEIETRVGPQQNKFGITQVFPWFGKLEARTDAASAKANAARQQYEASKLRLFREVKDAFYEYAYLAKAMDIARDNLELLKHFEEVALTKYRAATATHPDVIRARMELAKLEDVLKSLEELREPTAAKLNSILNRKTDTLLPWPQSPEPIDVNLVREEVIESVVRMNPELTAMDWQTEAARAEVEVAKKKFYPDIGIGVDWIQTDDAVMPGVRDSGKDAVALMFSVNIPLWRDSYKAAERQARANVRRMREQKIEAQNRKIFQALQVIYDIEDSRRKMDLYGEVLISMARELVQSSESAYRTGTVDFLSLIDAQRMLLNYRLNYHRVITDNQQSIAALEALTGEEYNRPK